MMREEGNLDHIPAYPLVPIKINKKVDCDPQPAFAVSQYRRAL